MRSVEKEWLELTERNKSEGKLVRFYDAQGMPKFEGKIDGYGWGSANRTERGFKWARFSECRTLKKDLTTRKGSASSREQTIPYDWQFIFVGEDKEISIPKTAGELTDEHIGMKFTFHGYPVIDGIYRGKNPGYDSPTRVKIKVEHAEGIEWSWAGGYFIENNKKLVYLGVTGKGPGVDTDAKLAAYLNQELGKWFDKVGSYDQWPLQNKLGQEVVRLIKEITQPTP